MGAGSQSSMLGLLGLRVLPRCFVTSSLGNWNYLRVWCVPGFFVTLGLRPRKSVGNQQQFKTTRVLGKTKREHTQDLSQGCWLYVLLEMFGPCVLQMCFGTSGSGPFVFFCRRLGFNKWPLSNNLMEAAPMCQSTSVSREFQTNLVLAF